MGVHCPPIWVLVSLRTATIGVMLCPIKDAIVISPKDGGRNFHGLANCQNFLARVFFARVCLGNCSIPGQLLAIGLRRKIFGVILGSLSTKKINRQVGLGRIELVKSLARQIFVFLPRLEIPQCSHIF